MVRTKEFDEEIVVDRAVRAFLKDSYSSTSVSALEAATGIGRKSIYNTFGSKQALLMRALDKFAHESSVKFIEPLERDGAGREAIEHVVLADFFVGVLIGISTMARTGATPGAIGNYADVALRALG